MHMCRRQWVASNIVQRSADHVVNMCHMTKTVQSKKQHTRKRHECDDNFKLFYLNFHLNMNKYNEEKLSGERILYSVPYLLSEDRSVLKSTQS